MSVTEIKVTDLYDNASTTSEALDIMREEYGNDQGWHVPRINLQHALLGKLEAAGIAYVNGICKSSIGFGINGGVIGNIDDIGQGMYYDLRVFSHEVG